MNIVKLLGVIQLGVCFINIVMGLLLLRNRQFFQSEIRYILSFCIIDFLTSLFQINGVLRNVTNLSFDNINVIFEFGEIVLLPAYISETIGKRHNWNTVIIICSIFLILSVYNVSLFEPIIQLFTTVFISSYCLKYLLWIFNSEEIINITKTKHFWIIIGIMICYTSSLPSSFAALLLTLIGTENKFNAFINSLYLAYFILNVIMHCFFIKSFKWRGNSQ